VEREYYLTVFEEGVRATMASFRPDLVIMSAGFDCLAGDPLGGLLLEPVDLYTMTRQVMDAADAPVIAVLEGGYIPKRAADGAVQVVRAFADLPPLD
jgi:acetoin utilization deacetylase AcuC-like enzyme